MNKYLCAALLVMPFLLSGETPWEIGEWITISDMRYVTNISESHKYIYVSTTNGLLMWDKMSGRWLFPYSWQDLLGEEKVYYARVFGANLFIRTETGVYALRETNIGTQAPRLVSFQPENIRINQCPEQFPLYLPPPQYIFKQDGIIMDPDFVQYPVSACLIDRAGNLWLGTWGLGTWFVDTKTLKMEMQPIGLQNENVRAIFINSRGIWFGGEVLGQTTCGVTFWNRKKDVWNFFNSHIYRDMGTDNIYAITGNDTLVFFGTQLGLLVYNSNTERWKRYSTRDGLPYNEITSLCLKNDTLFIGLQTGIAIFDLKTRKCAPVSPSSYPKVNKMAVYKDRIYFATDEGAFYFNGKFPVQIRTPDGYLEYRVYAVQADSNGLWFATDRGLLFYNPATDERRTFPAEIYLPEYVNDMLNTTRYIWFATNSGVVKLRKNDMRFYRYTTSDGLASNIVYTLAEDGDYIWFGTSKGATRYLWNKESRIDW